MAKRKQIKCIDLPNLTISMEQTDFDSFTVTYGKQVKTDLDYATAAAKLGQCIMHALACEGRLDNRTRAEGRADGDRKPFVDVGTALYVMSPS